MEHRQETLCRQIPPDPREVLEDFLAAVSGIYPETERSSLRIIFLGGILYEETLQLPGSLITP